MQNNNIIKVSKHQITDKIIISVGCIGFVLIIINSIMIYIIPMPPRSFSYFTPFWMSEFRAFLFYFFIIVSSFLRFRFLLVVITFLSPYLLFYGMLGFISGLKDHQLILYKVGGILGFLNILLVLATFLGIFFWWKESHCIKKV